MLPKKRNEVCAILYLEDGQDDGGPLLIDVAQCNIIGKRNLICTNALYPKYSFPGSEALVQRWNFYIFYDATHRQARPVEEALQRISPCEASAGCHVSEKELSRSWRGNITPKQNYTLFDAFSGAGGVSRGAQRAGFQVLYGLDMSPDVWDTYSANFPAATLFRMAVDEFIHSQRDQLRVDVLHLSPPCQPFSPAHTRQDAHDDDNRFALFGCGNLISRTQPRLITLEETFGIVHDRHNEYFHAIISDMTHLGFSVRWRVVRLCTWGLAQDRRRLVLLAAAPGEKLPGFPPPTHCEGGGPGLRPFTTLAQAIGKARRNDDLHDLHAVRRYHPRRAPLRGRLVGTITTGCAGVYHPDGTRDLTLRELASLQGFPPYHCFKGTKTSIRRQIGNAFPPKAVQVLYDHLRRFLLQQDGIQTESIRTRPHRSVSVVDLT